MNVLKRYNSLPIPVRASIIYIICSTLQKGISFIVVPIYTRIVPSEQYGIFSLYQSWNEILCIFLTLNMWNYLYSNGMIKYENVKNDFTSSLCGLGFVITSIWLLIYVLFNKSIKKLLDLSGILILYLFLDYYFRPCFEYWCARQRFEYNIKKYCMVSVIISIITPIASLILINIMKENKGIALITSKILCTIPFYLVIMFVTLSKSKKIYNKEVWKYAIKYNVPLIPHFLSVVILSQSDRIMIGNICGRSEVAIYSVAYSVASVMLIINSAIMDSIIPWTYQHLKIKQMEKISFVGNISLGIIALINIILILIAPEIIKIMAPQEYKIAIYIISPVAISNIFIFMFNLFANIEYYYEDTKFVIFASTISAILNIILNMIFINKFGFLAAGYTTVACYLIYALLHFIFMRHVAKKNRISNPIYDYKILWLIAISSLILGLIIIVTYNFLFIRFIILLSICMFIKIKGNTMFSLLLMIKKNNNNGDSRFL